MAEPFPKSLLIQPMLARSQQSGTILYKMRKGLIMKNITLLALDTSTGACSVTLA